MLASDPSRRAVRWFGAVWALSWVVKLGAFLAFLLLVVELTGGH